MICVDTSIWVAALRDRRSAEAVRLELILDESGVVLPVPVRIEILSGARAKDRKVLRDRLGALTVVFPTLETWNLIDGWLDIAGRSGECFGVGDLLIAALAADVSAPVWSADGDFARMARLGFITLYETD